MKKSDLFELFKLCDKKDRGTLDTCIDTMLAARHDIVESSVCDGTAEAQKKKEKLLAEAEICRIEANRISQKYTTLPLLGEPIEAALKELSSYLYERRI